MTHGYQIRMTSLWVSTAWVVGIVIFILVALAVAGITLAMVWGDKRVSDERQSDPGRLQQPRRRARR